MNENLHIHIESLTAKVLENLASKSVVDKNDERTGVFMDMNDAIEASYVAQKELVKLPMEERNSLIESIRACANQQAEELAKMTVEETGMGRVEDKILKNKLAAEKTPGTEDLRTESFSGDNGLTVVELSPFGVIGSITPTTNPTETVINNGIGMIAAGNAVVFSPHPSAKKTTVKVIQMLNEAIVEAGGPRNLLTTIAQPKVEQTNILLSHEKIQMIVATGGPGLVNLALSSGKKTIGAGAGNPPALVDETANIEKAAEDIVAGASFDNNLPCTSEEEVIVVDSVADYLKFNMKKYRTYEIEDKNTLKKLEELIIQDGRINKAYVGRDAGYILEKIGISTEQDVRLIMMEVDFNHPLVQLELMMPILPIVRVKDVKQGIELAVKAEHGNRHTAIMHSKNVDHLTEFGRKIQTTIFVKNGPSYCGIGIGGEGHTTFTIAGPTGEGLTSAKSFARRRRCVLVDGLSIR